MEDVVYTPFELGKLIPLPHEDDNKYSRGVLSIVGGGASYPGAACLAACAGQRMGAGYTQVWCAPESLDAVRQGHPSLVVRSWEDSSLSGILRKSAQESCAVLIGCGFEGHDEGEQRLLKTVLELMLPTVVDGGGLSCLAELMRCEGARLLENRARVGIPLVLTPQDAEARRLAAAAAASSGAAAATEEDADSQLGSAAATAGGKPGAPYGSVAAEEGADAQRVLAQALAHAYYATVVAKGPQTVVGERKRSYLMDQGKAALAKAGTGDVLAGMIAALLAQGLPPFEAGVLGSTLHAHAARLAAEDLTAVSLIPEDVIEYIPHTVKKLLSTSAAPAERFFQKG